MLFANPAHLSTWGPARTANGRSRHDYDSDEHLLSEMLNENYLAGLLGDISPGDLIWIIDAQREQALVRVDWIDKPGTKVGLSVVERISEHSVVGKDGLTVKWRGPRGGFWAVIDGEGAVLSRDHKTREEAERARDIVKASSKTKAEAA